jgi:regulator of replication initiation timing
VKGRTDQDQSVQKISGSPLDIDKFAQTIASHLDDANQDKNLKIRSLANELPPGIKTGLFNFAKDLGKTIDDLNQNDIDQFQVKKLPEIMKNELVRLNLPEGGFEQELQDLKSKLHASGAENLNLKVQLKKLLIDINILKDSKYKVADLKKDTDKLVSETQFKLTEDHDSDLREHYQTKLREQKYLDGTDSERLAELLHRESKLISDLKEQELKSKKLEVELSHKEAYYTQELIKSDRIIKAKDLFNLKTKEAYTKLIEKKDRDASELRGKIDQLNILIAKSSSHSNAVLARDLEKQNLNLVKQIDFLKEKLSTLSSKMDVAKADNPENRSDLRKLQLVNQQMKNKLEAVFKEKEKLQAKLVEDTNLVTQLRATIIKLEMKLSEALNLNDEPSGPTHKIVTDQEAKTINIHNQILENQIKDYVAKISGLEMKLAEFTKGTKGSAGGGAGEETSKVKVGQLEASVKKLTQDVTDLKNQLGESKKEANKLRQEKTALQNQLDKMNKGGKKGGKAA